MWQFHDAQLALRNQKRYEHLHTDQWFQSYWCFQYISTPLFHCMHWPRPSRPPWRTRTWTRSRGRVDIENNITLEPEVWIKRFEAFLKAENKQNSMAMSLTSRQNWFSCFGVTKVKWLTIPLQNVLAEEDQPALTCLPHHRALSEEDVAIHHQGNMNMQLVSFLFNTYNYSLAILSPSWSNPTFPGCPTETWVFSAGE